MQIATWKRNRQLRCVRKQLRRLLKDARHTRNMREDIASPDVLTKLNTAEARARQILSSQADIRQLIDAAETLSSAISVLMPARPYAAWRENIEVIVVAVAVAMAFRAYFIQPFKIPTSSMFPTLHGIKYNHSPTTPSLFDHWPLKLGKWMLFGEWYSELRAAQTGPTRLVQDRQGRQFILVNQAQHEIFPGMKLEITPGQSVYQGQLLASGIRTAGDHIFVNRLIWHFRQPRRGEIMVFKTTGITHPQIKKNEHYVKRMVGLPNESLQIVPPDLMINGQPVEQPDIFRRIQSSAGDYVGYVNTGDFLQECRGVVHLGANDYFACGDNQHNSLDSRYWGPVPRSNLVGPTFFVYWPFSRRWGWPH